MHHLKFKKIRIEFGVSIKEISTLLNMTDANYAKIERGEIEISIKNLIKLSDYYKVPVDELIMKIIMKKLIYKKLMNTC
jgi:transcriptional regulator with XRE-family HTH domain